MSKVEADGERRPFLKVFNEELCKMIATRQSHAGKGVDDLQAAVDTVRQHAAADTAGVLSGDVTTPSAVGPPTPSPAAHDDPHDNGVE